MHEPIQINVLVCIHTFAHLQAKMCLLADAHAMFARASPAHSNRLYKSIQIILHNHTHTNTHTFTHTNTFTSTYM